MIWLYGLAIIVVASGLLYVAGKFLVSSLLRLSQYFKVTEFAVAFFVMAFAASLPNLFVGVTSALQGVPELSFGDIMGNNILVMTVAVALSILFAPRRELLIETDTVKDTALFTSVVAILPLILISDGFLSRSDGLILISFFFAYVYWLFVRSGRFSREFRSETESLPRESILVDIIKVVCGVALLALSAQAIVYGASLLGASIGLPLILIGILITGLGGALPEIYFAIESARREETGLIIGSLLGAVIVPATLVLGLVAIIHPIENDLFSFSLLNRVFLVAVAIFFLYISQVKKIITWRESLVLMGFYVAFLLSIFAL